MYTRTKHVLQLFLLCAALFALALCAPAEETDEQDDIFPSEIYRDGNIITMGSYPQSLVTDVKLTNKLEIQHSEWVSYGYYINGERSDVMRYKDVTLDGVKYRAVEFTYFRPRYTDARSTAEGSEQDDNIYRQNQNFWFRYEPIRWRVLDASNQEDILVVSESILDSQAFRNTYFNDSHSGDDFGYRTDSTKTYYANNYAQSDIRAWLNEDFYNTAFSAEEQALIYTTNVVNEAHPSYGAYDAASTQDKVFLLSYKDVTNPDYGFGTDPRAPDITRWAKGSDYAKSQGLYVQRWLSPSSTYDYTGNSSWWLRSAAFISYLACTTDEIGTVSYGTFMDTGCGVRPAFRLCPTTAHGMVKIVADSPVQPEPRETAASDETEVATSTSEVTESTMETSLVTAQPETSESTPSEKEAPSADSSYLVPSLLCLLGIALLAIVILCVVLCLRLRQSSKVSRKNDQ